MNSLTPDQELLLERIATGDLDSNAEEVRVEAGRSRDFAAEVERVVRMLARLDAASTDAKRIVAEATDPSLRAGGESDVFHAVRERLGGAGESKTTPNRPRARLVRMVAILALAAAAMLAIVWNRERGSGAGSDDPTRYLGDDLRCVAPLGEAADFRRFEFEGILPAGAWFEVVIFAADGSEKIRSPRLETTRFELTDEQVRTLPDEIEWQVILRDIGGIRSSATAVARR